MGLHDQYKNINKKISGSQPYPSTGRITLSADSHER